MFERENKFEKKESAQPHSDAQRNYHYCLDLLRKIEVLEGSLSWEIYDFKSDEYDNEGQPIKIVTDIKNIIFTWHEGRRNWTGERSFHMPHEEFKKQFTDAINFLLQKRFVKRFGVPIGTRKKIEPQNRMKDSFQELFGRT